MLKKIIPNLTQTQLNLIVLAGGAFILYKLYSGAAEAVEAVVEGAKEAVEAVNPTNYDNIFNTAFNDLTQWATGDDNFTLGSWLYDVLNPDPFNEDTKP